MMRRLTMILMATAIAAVAGCGVKPAYGPSLRGGDLSARAIKTRVHEPGELKLHVLPESGDRFLLSALRGAKRVIRLQMYLLTHQGVMDELIAAKARGVDVQVLLEGRPYNPGNPSQPLPTNKRAAAYLAKGKVDVRWTSETFRYTHAKAVTIDDAVTFVSTANFTKSGLGLGKYAAREYVIADRSPSDVAEFVAMFKADWAHEPYVPQDDDLIVSPSNAREKIFQLVRSAKREVKLAVEVAVDEQFNALVAEKVKSGVKVQALLGDHNKIGVNLQTAEIWRKHGAQVRFQAKPFLHAKVIVIDGQVLYVGSVNLTANSMDNNRELGLKIATPEVVRAVEKTVDGDWQAASDRPVNWTQAPYSWLEPLL